MHIHTAKVREAENNTLYQVEENIGRLEDLLQAARYDHIAAKTKDDRRGKDRFISADGVISDLDNTHSNDPEDWKTLDDVQDAFPDVEFYYVESRNHMKEKTKVDKAGNVTKYEPREKYHLYFPLSGEVDAQGFKKTIMTACGVFPFLDPAAVDSMHFFYGVEAPRGGHIEGTQTLDQFIETVSKDECIGNLEKFIADGFSNGDKAFKKVPEFFGMVPQPAAIQPAADWIQEAEKKKSVKWFLDWSKEYDVEILGQYEIDQPDHPKATVFCVTCPWEDEHSMNGPENETVVIVDITGKLNFLCRHGHDYSWKEYREKIESQKPAPEVVPCDEIGRPIPPEMKLVFSKNGTLKKSFDNLCEVMEHDQELRGRIYFDAFTGKIMLDGMAWRSDPHQIGDVDLNRARQYLTRCWGFSSKDNIADAFSVVADNHRVHPVNDLLNSLVWDGQERISELLPRYLGAERSAYTAAVTRLFLYGVIRRVQSPGIKFDYVPVLCDRKQGTGKSTLCRLLALNDEWFTDRLGDLSNDAAAYEATIGSLVIELSEMLTVKKTSMVESLKAFLTRQVDTYRQPYSRYTEKRPRQFVMIGTSNNPTSLPLDMTGNRRFLPLMCDGNKAQLHPMEHEEEARDYVLQCYAQAMTEGARDGFPLTLDKDLLDTARRLQEGAAPVDEDLTVIQSFIDETGREIVCTRMLYYEAINHSSVYLCNKRPQQYELQKIADLMDLKMDGWKRYAGKDGKTLNAKYRFKGIDSAYGVARAWIRIGSEYDVAAQGKFVAGRDEILLPVKEAATKLEEANDCEIPF